MEEQGCEGILLCYERETDLLIFHKVVLRNIDEKDEELHVSHLLLSFPFLLLSMRDFNMPKCLVISFPLSFPSLLFYPTSGHSSHCTSSVFLNSYKSIMDRWIPFPSFLYPLFHFRVLRKSETLTFIIVVLDD